MPLKIRGLFTKHPLQLPDETNDVCWHMVNLVISLQIAYQYELSFVHCNLTIFAPGVIFSPFSLRKKVGVFCVFFSFSLVFLFFL